MAFWESGFSGQYGGQYRLRVNVDVVGQEVANNRSLIRYSAWMEQVGSSVYSVYNNNGISANTNINGHNPGRGGALALNGPGQRRYIAQNEDYWIGHDGNGDANPYFGANLNTGVGVVGSAATGGNMWMPHINRYININAWSTGSITERTVNVNVQTSGTADMVDYSINDTGWQRGFTGGFTNRTFTIGGLNPNTTYNVRVRVRNASGGLWTDSGLKTIKTAPVFVSEATLNSVQDTSAVIFVRTSHVVDIIQYRLSPTSSWNNTTGSMTSAELSIYNLTPNQTYNIQIRARHQASGTYTDIVTVIAKTVLPTPLKPIDMNPGGGGATIVQRPSLNWTFTSTSPDYQTAYQVILYNAATAAVVFDTGKVASTAWSHQMPASTPMVFGTTYQWKVRTWSSADIEGPYSDLTLFKLSQAPSIAFTNPTASEVLNTNTPTITWSYSDPEGLLQSSYKILIEKIDSLSDDIGDKVYEQTVNGSTDPAHSIPSGFLENGGIYQVYLEVFDADGIPGIPPKQKFSVQFVAPEPPTIAAELSEDKLFTRVRLETNKPDNDAFETDMIKVYKREVGKVDWESIGDVQAISNNIESFDSTSGWLQSAGANGLNINPNAKQGTNSLSFLKTGAQTAVFTKTPEITTIAGYDKMRIWVYALDASGLWSIMLKIGKDYQNFYSYLIDSSVIDDQVWTSVEIDIPSMTIQGNPSLNEIEWIQIEVNSPGNITNGQVLIDGWRLPAPLSSLFLQDYSIANNHTYEYAASSYSTRENLESTKTIIQNTIHVEYDQYENTFIIPIGYETESMALFMDGSNVPSWTTTTDTAYYLPIGSKHPVSYALDTQKYRNGSMSFLFLDKLHDCNAIEESKKLENIMNRKPILLRTWWGENYYISIDGKITTTYSKNLGWIISFNFTEIRNV